MEENFRYFHRDLSWLLFNRRVIEQAYDSDYPILEQFRFLAIASSNLDEFFEVRVPEMRTNARYKPNDKAFDTELTHNEVLIRLKKRNQKNLDKQYNRYKELVEKLKESGEVQLKRYSELDNLEIERAEQYFVDVVFPALSPIGLDSYRATPKVEEKLIYLFLHLTKENEESGQVVVPLPAGLERLVRINQTFITLEEIIIANAEKMFLGWKVKRGLAFRITYDKNLDFDEDPNEDMVEQMEDYLEERAKGLPSRVEISIRDGEMEDFSQDIEFLKEELDLKKRDFYYFNGPLDLTFLNEFIDLASDIKPEWVFKKLLPCMSPEFSEENIFATLDKKDIFLQHPYDSYDPIINFLNAAAKDPDTLVIKQTLYRVASDSKIIEALKTASRNGKQVSAVVELKARFDEENNLHWVDELQEAGVFVSYGVPEKKTHSKLTMVVKKSGRGTKTYVHIGTGNYNEKTSRIYTDLSILSSRAEYGQEGAALFNFLSGYSAVPKYTELAVSPFGIEDMILEKTQSVIDYHKETGKGKLFLKVNAVTSKPIVEKLYEASQAGVKILMIVRGACILRPGVEGLSENIEVRSVIGRYLEHSRIYAFDSGEKEFWISSADTMTRNMRRRVEVAAKVGSEEARKDIEKIINTFADSTKKVFILKETGLYDFPENASGLNPQDVFVKEAIEKAESIKNKESKLKKKKKEKPSPNKGNLFSRIFSRN